MCIVFPLKKGKMNAKNYQVFELFQFQPTVPIPNLVITEEFVLFIAVTVLK